MLKLKTVVLVTHQVNMSAPYADRIVVLDGDGTIKEQGTYEVTPVLPPDAQTSSVGVFYGSG